MKKDNQENSCEKEKWAGIIKASGEMIAKMPPFIQHCLGISFICFSCVVACLFTSAFGALVYYLWHRFFE